MCGRYTLYSNKTEIESHFEAPFKTGEIPGENYNVAPGTYNPVMLHGKARVPGITLMKWGLIPSFADSESIGYKMMNARSETVDTKPSFRKSFLRKRCLIPANGFYEWKNLGTKNKLPFYIRLLNQELFAFAGIFEKWVSPENEDVFSYSIITTEANTLLQPLHERMPVILDKENYKFWMDPMNNDYQGLKDIMKPYPTELMSVFRISDEVNKATNNHRALIEPMV